MSHDCGEFGQMSRICGAKKNKIAKEGQIGYHISEDYRWAVWSLPKEGGDAYGVHNSK